MDRPHHDDPGPGDLSPEALRGLASRVPEVGAVRDLLRQAGVRRAWLVGGLLRDLAFLREPEPLDVDVALPGNADEAAAQVAAGMGGTAFPLDEAQGAWRVALPKGKKVDLVPLRASGIEADLAGRDFTVNALACDLLGEGGFLDPLGGLNDVGLKRLALCHPGALLEDPVRVLRGYRFAFGLDLSISADVAQRLAAAAPGLWQVAPERLRTELFAVLSLSNGAAALRAMAEHGVLEALFPFTAAWKGFDQGDYHAHDLLEHSLRALEAAERFCLHSELFPSPETMRAHLAQELEAGITRSALLKYAAFFHDVAKPETLRWDGRRKRFLGHDIQGGHRVRSLLASLRVGRKARAVAQRVIAAHLRLFGLASQVPPTRAARQRYLRDLGGDVPEAVLLSLADEVATGPEPPALPALERTARELLALHWDQRSRGEVPPLIRGRDLVEVLGIPEGPLIGDILRRVAIAETRGEVGTRGDALDLARRIWEGAR